MKGCTPLCHPMLPLRRGDEFKATVLVFFVVPSNKKREPILWPQSDTEKALAGNLDAISLFEKMTLNRDCHC
jgi:hypothetical protein